MELLIGAWRGLRRLPAAAARHASSATVAAPPLQVSEAEVEAEVEGEGEGEGEGGWPRRVVSGLQPTGALHVGNYFGAVRRLVRAQRSGDDVTVFVADLHALTVPRGGGAGGGGGEALHERSLRVAALLLAAGLEPARGAVFLQSAVPRHAELCWVLACLATNARLQHLPQYREKAAAVREVPLGLLLYPVLQAADVLVYRGTHVPVGRDQLQHLQVAAQLVRTFHHRYGRAFPTPRPMLTDDGSDRLLSLRNPAKKMSKSDPDVKSCILLTDPDDVIHLKIRKAVTDFTPQVTFDPENRPGVSNLITLHCLAADKTPEEVVEESDGLTTAQYKRVVSAAVCAELGPVRARAAALLARPRALRHVLRDGAARARARADRVYEHVARLAGLVPAPAPAPAVRLHSVRLPPAPAPAPAPAEREHQRARRDASEVTLR